MIPERRAEVTVTRTTLPDDLNVYMVVEMPKESWEKIAKGFPQIRTEYVSEKPDGNSVP